ncbi:TetR family transcriptional regulator [Nocardia testacea]|uniref:TetR/AcrR family transcriptional regulator n=1 Tax=Nocardia testacea TaxID=248551 RepID=UPI0033D422FC
MPESGEHDVTAPRRPGRPRSSATPDAIRQAASTLFAERGFNGTSVRDIAGAAGCDPAVIIRHFGSKEKLFLQVVPASPHLADLVAGPLDTLGRRILERLVDPGRSSLGFYATLLGALDRPDVRHYLEESTARNIIEPLAQRLPGPQAELRAQLIAAQIGGLLMSTYVFESASALTADPEAMSLYADALQALIDGPPTAGASEA